MNHGNGVKTIYILHCFALAVKEKKKPVSFKNTLDRVI